jgi:hypothetical protein
MQLEISDYISYYSGNGRGQQWNDIPTQGLASSPLLWGPCVCGFFALQLCFLLLLGDTLFIFFRRGNWLGRRILDKAGRPIKWKTLRTISWGITKHVISNLQISVT